MPVFWIVIILLILNIPLYIWFFKFFFRDAKEFNKALMFLVRPNIVSIIKGEYWDDVGASLKAAMYFIMCGTVVFIETILVQKILEL